MFVETSNVPFWMLILLDGLLLSGDQFLGIWRDMEGDSLEELWSLGLQNHFRDS